MADPKLLTARDFRAGIKYAFILGVAFGALCTAVIMS